MKLVTSYLYFGKGKAHTQKRGDRVISSSQQQVRNILEADK